MKPRITPTIMDGVVVRWGDKGSDNEISASRNGVMVHGWMILRTPHDRAELERIVALAWDCYTFLSKRAERFTTASSDEVFAWLTGRGIEAEEAVFP